MNEKADALKRRTKRFALDVLAFGRTLPGDDQSRGIARQIPSEAGVAIGKRVSELLDEATQLRAIFTASSITAGGSPRR